MVFVRIMTYCHESWVMTERILCQVQAAEMRFLGRVHGMTLRDKVRSFEIRRVMNVEPHLLRIERSQLRCFSHVSRMPHNRLTRSCGLWPRESCPEVVHGPDEVTTFPTLLGPVLVWSQQNYLKFLLTVRGYESTLWAAAPRPSLKEKKTWKWWKIYWNRFCEAVMNTWFIFQVHILNMNEIKSKLRWKPLSV